MLTLTRTVLVRGAYACVYDAYAYDAYERAYDAVYDDAYSFTSRSKVPLTPMLMLAFSSGSKNGCVANCHRGIKR